MTVATKPIAKTGACWGGRHDVCPGAGLDPHWTRTTGERQVPCACECHEGVPDADDH